MCFWLGLLPFPYAVLLLAVSYFYLPLPADVYSDRDGVSA